MRLFLFLIFTFFTINGFSQTSAEQRDTTIQVKEDFKDDWADLNHYAEANKAVNKAKRSDKRIIFLGSSIFERWNQQDPEYFARNPNYINRGISGQISPQLLIRFRQDVISLNPKAVIILAGSNDIAGSTGHVTTETIMNNIRSMTELARKNHIKVILCAYLPVYDYPWRKGLKPAEKIIELNKEITAYAKRNRLLLLDYFSPMADERNGQKAELTLDGVHPNRAGYNIMESQTDEIIGKL